MKEAPVWSQFHSHFALPVMACILFFQRIRMLEKQTRQAKQCFRRKNRPRRLTGGLRPLRILESGFVACNAIKSLSLSSSKPKQTPEKNPSEAMILKRAFYAALEATRAI